LFGGELSGFAKATVVLVAVLLVGFGLCAVSGPLEQPHGCLYIGGPCFPETAFAHTIDALEWIGAGAIVLSVAGLAFVIVGWPVSSLYRSMTQPDRDGLQRLFDDSKRDEGDEGTMQ
jgi:hypothetical protein